MFQPNDSVHPPPNNFCQWQSQQHLERHTDNQMWQSWNFPTFVSIWKLNAYLRLLKLAYILKDAYPSIHIYLLVIILNFRVIEGHSFILAIPNVWVQCFNFTYCIGTITRQTLGSFWNELDFHFVLDVNETFRLHRFQSIDCCIL